MKEDFLKQLNELSEIVRRLAGRFDIENKKNLMRELEVELTRPDLWQNKKLAEQKNKEAGQLRDLINRYEEIEKELIDAEISLNQSVLDGKEWTEKSNQIIFSIKKKIQVLEIERLFSGKYDKQSAVLSIYAGAGGDDAEDWASMLYEMYHKFAEKRGWKTSVIDESLGDFQSKTGRHPLKNVTIEIKGDYGTIPLKRFVWVVEEGPHYFHHHGPTRTTTSYSLGVEFTAEGELVLKYVHQAEQSLGLDPDWDEEARFTASDVEFMRAIAYGPLLAG